MKKLSKLSKLISLALALTTITSAEVYCSPFEKCPVFSAVAESSDSLTYENFEYKKFSDHIEITGFEETDEMVYIPDEIEDLPVTVIASGAFKGCTASYISLPSYLEKICSYAFAECKNIKYISVPSGVTEIGEGAFSDCSMETFSFPKDLTSIEKGVLRGCSALTSVAIPESVRSVGDSAFEDCVSIEKTVIPDSVETIGADAFRGCKNLSVAELPESVVSIGEGAFSLCENLQLVVVKNPDCEIFDSSETISNSISDGVGTFSGDICSAENSRAKSYAEKYGYTFRSVSEASVAHLTFEKYDNHAEVTGFDNLLSEVVIPGEVDGLPVTAIADEAFAWCSFNKVEISEGVTKIGQGAFSQCLDLNFVSLPDSLEIIGDRAFFGCSDLSSVTVPKSVKSIGDFAFSGLYRGLDITILSPDCEIFDSPTAIGNETFSEKAINIYGCEGSTAQAYAEKYNEPLHWINFTVIDGDLGKFGKFVYKKYSDHAEITGCEKLAVEADIPSEIEDLPVVNIAEGAFKDCTDVKKINIPDSVTEISKNAFENCESLSDVYIPDSVTKIGEQAFSGCAELSIVRMSGCVTRIEKQTFSGCGLRTFDIPPSVTFIGNEAFKDCKDLIKINVPETVTAMGKNIFTGCESLECVIFGDVFLAGDANESGDVTIADSVAVLQFIANPDEYPLSEQGLENADVSNTGDGVNVEDALKISLFCANITDTI